MIVHRPVTVALLSVALAGMSSATTLVSSAALQATGVGTSDRLICQVSNVSTKPVLITTVRIVNDDNPSQDTTGGFAFNNCDGTTLAPGAGCSTATTDGIDPVMAHCTVTFKGSRTGLRAALWVADSSHNLSGQVVPAN